MEKYIVYKISNKINDKIYFGITKCSVRKRWIQHKCNSTRKKYHLYRAMKKYGIENFSISIVKECISEKEMYDLEKKLIKKYKTNNREYGYNNSTGGEISSKGKVLSDEAKKKISDYQKNRKRKPHSRAAIEKMKKAAKGRDMSKVIAASAKARRGVPSKRRKPVYSVNRNGEIKEYDSITGASKATGISITSIANNLLGYSKSAGKLIWNYQHKN